MEGPKSIKMVPIKRTHYVSQALKLLRKVKARSATGGCLTSVRTITPGWAHPRPGGGSQGHPREGAGPPPSLPVSGMGGGPVRGPLGCLLTPGDRGWTPTGSPEGLRAAPGLGSPQPPPPTCFGFTVTRSHCVHCPASGPATGDSSWTPGHSPGPGGAAQSPAGTRPPCCRVRGGWPVWAWPPGNAAARGTRGCPRRALPPAAPTAGRGLGSAGHFVLVSRKNAHGKSLFKGHMKCPLTSWAPGGRQKQAASLLGAYEGQESTFCSGLTSQSNISIFLKDFVYLFMKDPQREAETQAEGEAGSLQGARRGT